MNEQEQAVWWQLHRRVAMGETLSAVEQQSYEAVRAELEAEEWADLRPASEALRPLQDRLRELTSRNQQLAQQESALRSRAAELERNYTSLTGEKLGLEA